MLPLSGDSQPGFKPGAASVLVLRFGSGGLEIGFGTTHPSGQESLKDHFTSDPTLQLSVEFPQNGEKPTYTIGLLDGYTRGLGDGYAPGFRDRGTREQLLAFSLDVLAPFEFSGLPYAPLDSIAASVARLAEAEAGKSGHASGQPVDRLGSTVDGLCKPADRPSSSAGGFGRPNDVLMALWAALETDLYRFAKDPGFTAALDVAATEHPEEYRRFARLNDLYRDMVKLLVPYGLAPRRWTAWLRGQEYRPLLPVSLALSLETFLAGRAGQAEEARDALAGLLVKHGALVMKPVP